MANFMQFRTPVCQVMKAQRKEGRPKDGGGKWEDSYFVDVAYMGGREGLRALNQQVFDQIREGGTYIFAGELKRGGNFDGKQMPPSFIIHEIRDGDGKPVSSPDTAARR